jgi:hypothetical protein
MVDVQLCTQVQFHILCRLSGISVTVYAYFSMYTCFQYTLKQRRTVVLQHIYNAVACCIQHSKRALHQL